MPSDNIYQEQRQGGLGTLVGFALPIGVFTGHHFSTNALATEASKRAPGRSILGGMLRGTEAGKSANDAAMSAWGAFFEGKGWDFSGRASAFNRALSTQSTETYTKVMQTAGKYPGVFETKATRAVFSKVPLGRTISAIARPALGLGVAWYSWASLIPPAIEGTLAGLGEMIRFGEKLRNTAPETSTHVRDMGTKEHAFTMRQAAAMAIHTSQTSTRAALGQEASFLH